MKYFRKYLSEEDFTQDKENVNNDTLAIIRPIGTVGLGEMKVSRGWKYMKLNSDKLNINGIKGGNTETK